MNPRINIQNLITQVQKLRYEYDRIWESTGRDSLGENNQFNIGAYSHSLDLSLMNFFNVLGLGRNQYEGSKGEFAPRIPDQFKTTGEARCGIWEIIKDNTAFEDFREKTKKELNLTSCKELFDTHVSYPCFCKAIKVDTNIVYIFMNEIEMANLNLGLETVKE